MSSTPTSLALDSSHWFPAVPKLAMLLPVSVPLSVLFPLFPVPFPPCSLGILNSPFKTQLKCHLLYKDHCPHLPLAKLVTLFCAATSYTSLCNSTYCSINIACMYLSPLRARDYLKLQLFPVSVSVFPVTNKALRTYQRFLHASWMNECMHNSLQGINKMKPLQFKIFIWGSYFHGENPPPLLSPQRTKVTCRLSIHWTGERVRSKYSITISISEPSFFRHKKMVTNFPGW